MIWAVLMLIPVSLAVSAASTWTLLRLGRRLGTFDTEPIPGQVKMPPRRVPNTGGIAIVLGVLGPMGAALVAASWMSDQIAHLLPELAGHLPGLTDEASAAAALIACTLSLHIVGLYDDRHPLGAVPKLLVMLAVSGALVMLTGSRLLELLDPTVGGPWLSVLVTVVWITIVVNAMNFMDNMDGLAGGSAAAAAGCILIAALLGGQWFVAGAAAMLLGAVMGFLIFNAPPARIFMGDGGSLVIGMLLAFLTVRTTYYQPDPVTDPERWLAGPWYAVLMPLAILAIPLYDFVSVTAVRLSQGKSPFVGDLQHFSHRLRRRGLSDAQTATVVAGLTAATGISGILLGSAGPWHAVLIGLQVALLLGVVSLLEWASSDRANRCPDSSQGSGSGNGPEP